MDSAKHTSSTDAQLLSSTSTKGGGTGGVRLRSVADSHDEDGRRSADPEKHATCQDPPFTGPDLTFSTESNTTKGRECDLAGGAATIKPSNQTWYEFFQIPPPEKSESSSISKEAQSSIELQHNTGDSGRLPRAASESSIVEGLSTTSIGTHAR